MSRRARPANLHRATKSKASAGRPSAQDLPTAAKHLHVVVTGTGDSAPAEDRRLGDSSPALRREECQARGLASRGTDPPSVKSRRSVGVPRRVDRPHLEPVVLLAQARVALGGDAERERCSVKPALERPGLACREREGRRCRRRGGLGLRAERCLWRGRIDRPGVGDRRAEVADRVPGPNAEGVRAVTEPVIRRRRGARVEAAVVHLAVERRRLVSRERKRRSAVVAEGRGVEIKRAVGARVSIVQV